MADTRLKTGYNSLQAMKALHERYALNPLGVKCIVKISTKRYNEIMKGDNLTEEEVINIENAIDELKGKINYEEF